MNQYELEYLNPALLVDYPLNAKKHDEAQIDKLAKEIEAVGFRVPIVVDHLGVIVAGHGRKAAAIKAGLGSVPVHRLPADISPERVRAMRLFDNRVSETGWDSEILANEIQSLFAIDQDLTALTGFASFEIDAFLNVDVGAPPLVIPSGNEPSEPSTEGVTNAEAQSSGFKQVQLLFTPEQYEKFKKACEVIAKRMELKNMTDVVFAVVLKEGDDGFAP